MPLPMKEAESTRPVRSQRANDTNHWCQPPRKQLLTSITETRRVVPRVLRSQNVNHCPGICGERGATDTEACHRAREVRQLKQTLKKK